MSFYDLCKMNIKGNVFAALYVVEDLVCVQTERTNRNRPDLDFDLRILI